MAKDCGSSGAEYVEPPFFKRPFSIRSGSTADLCTLLALKDLRDQMGDPQRCKACKKNWAATDSDKCQICLDNENAFK